MKKIKLLLPIISVSALATTITPLVGCKDKNPTPAPIEHNFVVLGGTKNLSGIIGNQGIDTQAWELYDNSVKVTSGVSYSIIDLVGIDDSDIDISDSGMVNWTAAATSGTFKVQAEYNSNTYTSDLITLTMGEQPQPPTKTEFELNRISYSCMGDTQIQCLVSDEFRIQPNQTYKFSFKWSDVRKIKNIWSAATLDEHLSDYAIQGWGFQLSNFTDVSSDTEYVIAKIQNHEDFKFHIDNNVIDWTVYNEGAIPTTGIISLQGLANIIPAQTFNLDDDTEYIFSGEIKTDTLISMHDLETEGDITTPVRFIMSSPVLGG